MINTIFWEWKKLLLHEKERAFAQLPYPIGCVPLFPSSKNRNLVYINLEETYMLAEKGVKILSMPDKGFTNKVTKKSESAMNQKQALTEKYLYLFVNWFLYHQKRVYLSYYLKTWI